MPKSNPSKTWVFTLNNYTDADVAWVENLATQAPRIVVTKEVGEGGTPHLQGYVTFATAMRLSALKKLSPRSHWEKAKAEECAALYPIKDDSVVVVNKNEKGCQGRRTDVQKAYTAVKGKRSLAQFLDEEEPAYQAIQVFKVAELALSPPRPIAPIEVIWRYGATGAGKTRWAWEHYPDLYSVMDYKWWDGYMGQETILIDDMRGDFCKFHELLTLLDIYPLRKQTKGGWVQVQFKRVIITSPSPPSELYRDRTAEDMRQLMRRITQTTLVVETIDLTDDIPEIPTEVIDLLGL